MSSWCYCCDSVACFFTWLSPLWLKLLSPLEFFVTIDHSALWQKHVAWAKPKGSELMTYITARYSTNMVLLSLLLAAEINVFFNSSTELTELRSALRHNPAQSLQFWIGMTLILDICVTLLGLVTTFTLWGMISAISPVNAHCLLRSTIGQYVISLPPRLLVAAMYLFWTWILLFVLEIVASPISWIFVGIIGIVFVSIVIPLSIFGRLILHTGAMSSKPILQTDLETQLLPSGLQASLWMRASSQQRRNNEVVSQYKHQRTSIEARQQETSGSEIASASAGNADKSETQEQASSHALRIARRKIESPMQEYALGCLNANELTPRTNQRGASSHHRRLSSNVLPPAFVLNSSITGKDLRDLLNSAVFRMSPTDENAQAGTQQDHSPSQDEHRYVPPTSPDSRENVRFRRHHRRESSRIVMEWVEDQDVRGLYGAAPAAELPDEEFHQSGLWNFRFAETDSNDPENVSNGSPLDDLAMPLLTGARKSEDSISAHKQMDAKGWSAANSVTLDSVV